MGKACGVGQSYILKQDDCGIEGQIKEQVKHERWNDVQARQDRHPRRSFDH